MRAMLEEEEGLDADAASSDAAPSDDAWPAEGAPVSDASPAEADDEEPDDDPTRDQQPPQQQQQPQQRQNGERRGKKKKKRRNQRGGDAAAEDSDGPHMQRAQSATVDPLAAELEALGLAGKGSDPSRSAAESELASERDEEGAADGSDDRGLDEEAMLDRLVGTRTEASAAEADGSAGSAEDSALGRAISAVTNGAAEGMAEGRQQAAFGPEGAASAGPARQRRAKTNGLSARGQAGASPLAERVSSAAAAEPPDGKPVTKRQKRKQKATQPAQAAEVPQLACGVCGVEFESRTQLFKHIAASGHALLKT